MPFVDVVTELAGRYGTGSHRGETLVSAGGEYPSQIKWSDLHPPGKQVLPKGSGLPAPGQINWEDTLGGKFAVAMKQLEGLLYAVYGSRPDAQSGLLPGTWIVRQWWDRQHPRCLWGPEIWKPKIIIGPPGCTASGACFDYELGEYAAMGQSPPGFTFPAPSVPVRSQSGDPAAQFAAGAHDRAVFPLGSVQRNRDAFPHDPQGGGSFGATQPGRQDGVGFVSKAGENVTFTYTLPPGVAVPDAVNLVWRIKAPGGAWSVWTPSAMAESGGVYTYTHPLQDHGTELQWYVHYTIASPVTDVYDPGGAAAPAAADAYYLKWYTHFQAGPGGNVDYGHGLPEMLDDYGDAGNVDIRRGTDFYRFDGSEVIQPGLINLARFTLAWLCGSTCLHDDVGCVESDGGSVVHHNPRFRGSPDDGLCCVSMPIRFYWSGSNTYPHYRRRGKGDPAAWTPLDTRPLSNHPTEPTLGTQAARMSWRGMANLYRGDPFDNPFFGGGLSWGQPPGQLELWYEPTHDPTARIYSKFEQAGLQPGDVIDPVHIQEIIDAVAYLVDYGIWTSAPICTRPRTPSEFMGQPCGRQKVDENRNHGTQCGAEFHSDSIDPCFQCCANSASCSQQGFVCQHYQVPTLADCRNPCQSSKCVMRADKEAHTCPDPFGPGIDCSCIQEKQFTINCGLGGSIGCGSHVEGGFQCDL